MMWNKEKVVIMDYEKKYKEALEKARQLCAYPTTKPFISDLQDLFPELKESDDERIRKELLNYFEHYGSTHCQGVKVADILVWLEKQGEQKSIDDLTQQEAMDIAVAKYFEQGEQKPQRMVSAEAKEAMYDKPAWSEEDEAKLKSILFHIEDVENKDEKDWLKSLKDRVQPQNKWKESLATADLENSLCDIQDAFSDTSYEYRTLGEAIEFIRCTESKPQWKPSDEQMKMVDKIINALSQMQLFGCRNALIDLKHDLEKLREE